MAESALLELLCVSMCVRQLSLLLEGSVIAAGRENAARSMAKCSLSPPSSPDWIYKQPQGGDNVMALGRRVSQKLRKGSPIHLEFFPPTLSTRHIFPENQQEEERMERALVFPPRG